MHHIFKEGTSKAEPTLLLLHGTGGDEHDLLPLADIIAPTSAVLSVRGNVNENGMNRFFRRIAEGVFDEADLLERTEELHNFINIAANKYEFERDNVVAIGYSNGANIAASLMYMKTNALAGAVLFKAMVPYKSKQPVDLQNTPIFIAAGKQDPLILPTETKKLISNLSENHANVTEHWIEGGHQLTTDEVKAAKQWFLNNFHS
ncbi:alpha/beta hydrolase [Bacillus sp. HMF5848]|uniref:alpha/beta hydrolase n=1 Tax=Bacillus sp. HMF5848 TaxID=2495421 RepID=UPI000F76FE64|nr:alpha/beta hydrolase [Bacillus sp. HMF5848]RSK27221.1 alpha/beta hydrolase [Bacillus sp. HMF5848]